MAETTDASFGRQGFCWLGLIFLILAAFAIGLQVISVFYALLFPPAVPRPPDTQELSYRYISPGLEEWGYLAQMNACELIRFYELEGGGCELLTTACAMTLNSNPEFAPRQTLALCNARISYGPFSMGWRARIKSGDDGLSETVLTLTRELFWLEQNPVP